MQKGMRTVPFGGDWFCPELVKLCSIAADKQCLSAIQWRRSSLEAPRPHTARHFSFCCSFASGPSHTLMPLSSEAIVAARLDSKLLLGGKTTSSKCTVRIFFYNNHLLCLFFKLFWSGLCQYIAVLESTTSHKLAKTV